VLEAIIFGMILALPKKLKRRMIDRLDLVVRAHPYAGAVHRGVWDPVKGAAAVMQYGPSRGAPPCDPLVLLQHKAVVLKKIENLPWRRPATVNFTMTLKESWEGIFAALMDYSCPCGRARREQPPKGSPFWKAARTRAVLAELLIALHHGRAPTTMHNLLANAERLRRQYLSTPRSVRSRVSE
jgi:hypothetical protein